MKRDMENLNLQNAFSPMPEECRDALLRSARSVKEEEKMKRAVGRTVLIVALILIATTAVAMAAGNLFGWNDFYGRLFDMNVPKKAQEILSDSPTAEFTVGNVRFTVREQLCDGYIALASTLAETADGSKVLLCMEPFDALGAIGENGEAYAQKLGVSSQMRAIDAARELDIPLYSVRAILEPDNEGMPEGMLVDAMEEAMWDENGNIVYFSLLDGLTPEYTGETYKINMLLRVAEYDIETDEEIARTKKNVTIELPVSKTLGERDYTPDAMLTVNGITLERVHAVHTVAGVYLQTWFKASRDADVQAFYDLCEGRYLDVQEQDYDIGMSLGTPSDVSKWPEASMTWMISEDELPEQLVFTMAGQRVTLQ